MAGGKPPAIFSDDLVGLISGGVFLFDLEILVAGGIAIADLGPAGLGVAEPFARIHLDQLACLPILFQQLREGALRGRGDR